MIFSSLDTYKVSHVKQNEKFNIDNKLLIRLYEPLIGSVAMSLYQTLESEVSLNKNTRVLLQIDRLTKVLHINDDQFNDAIESLKNYGLLTYKGNKRKENDYIFILNSTKSASEFFNDAKLVNDLKLIVDEAYYKQVYNYFISSYFDEDDYVEIDDVKLNKIQTDEEFYQSFCAKYPMISESIILDDTSKREISRLMKLFNLSYDQIENSILNSISYKEDSMYLDLNKLNDFVSTKIEVNKPKLTGMEEIANTFDSQKPIAYFQQLCNREALLPRETKAINAILDEYKISDGVFNVAINYYYQYASSRNTNTSFPETYIRKVIEGMLINNVKTTLDAMEYLRNRSRQTSTVKKKELPQQVVVTPEVKTIKREDDEEVTPELMEELRKAFGG